MSERGEGVCDRGAGEWASVDGKGGDEHGGEGKDVGEGDDGSMGVSEGQWLEGMRWWRWSQRTWWKGEGT